MGPPADLILSLKPRLRLEDFIETGTYRGETAAWAAAHFRRVTTIELAEQFHVKAAERFRAMPHVRTLFGNSAFVLREVVPSLVRGALFWLDAHWSGLDTAGRDSECPVLDEISVINDSPHVHAILVDDARLFCAPPPRPHRADHWPDLADTLSALVNGGQRYVVLFEDVLIAVPNTEREFLIGWMQDGTARDGLTNAGTSWWKKWCT